MNISSSAEKQSTACLKATWKTMPFTKKHWQISCTFLLKSFLTNQGYGLSARTSRQYAINFHKLTLLTSTLSPDQMPSC